MWGNQRKNRSSQVKLTTILGFLFGAAAIPAGIISIDTIYNIFNADIFKFLFGIYVFLGGFMVLVANLYLIFSGYGLVPTRGDLQRAPAVVQISYRFFYRPIVVGAAFLLGGALGNALF